MFFPEPEWKDLLPKGCWSQNSECSQAGRERMNADELPSDSCAYTPKKKKKK